MHFPKSFAVFVMPFYFCRKMPISDSDTGWYHSVALKTVNLSAIE